MRRRTRSVLHSQYAARSSRSSSGVSRSEEKVTWGEISIVSPVVARRLRRIGQRRQRFVDDGERAGDEEIVRAHAEDIAAIVGGGERAIRVCQLDLEGLARHAVGLGKSDAERNRAAFQTRSRRRDR